ncbi:MAG: hypothetical protein AABY64_07455 [Bdellovibrionota bacterium]
MKLNGPFRIAVVGTSCSGKSTLAKEISKKLSIKYIEQDQLFWRPGWVQVPQDEFRIALLNEISGNQWTICGNHSSFKNEIWSRATHIVWLNYPFHIIWRRALKRTLRRVFLKEKCCNGNVESFRHAFLSTNSILWWVLKTHRKRQVEYSALKSDQILRLKFIEHQSPTETMNWLRNLDC